MLCSFASTRKIFIDAKIMKGRKISQVKKKLFTYVFQIENFYYIIWWIIHHTRRYNTCTIISPKMDQVLKDCPYYFIRTIFFRVVNPRWYDGMYNFGTKPLRILKKTDVTMNDYIGILFISTLLPQHTICKSFMQL